MGSGVSRQYVVDEQLKPQNASDIAEGDFDAAKKEVERLRWLISQVDCDMLDAIEGAKQQPKGSKRRDRFAMAEGDDKDIAVHHGSPNKTLTVETQQKDGSELSPSHEKTEGRCVIENGTESPSKKGSPVKTQKKRRVTDEDGFAIVPQLSPDESRKLQLMNSLLDDIKMHIFSKTKTIEEAFLKLDKDNSGYISRKEFKSAMSEMGFFMTDKEFDLINLTYPHHEALDEEDKGISYLEFVTMLTGKLTYVPGYGEDVEISEPDRARAMLCQEMEQEDDTHLWHNYLMVKRKREDELQGAFSRRVFEEFYSMKEAFDKIDEDNSGFIDQAELKEVLRTSLNIEATDEAIADLMNEFDLNHDGKLQYHEFVKLLEVGSPLDI